MDQLVNHVGTVLPHLEAGAAQAARELARWQELQPSGDPLAGECARRERALLDLYGQHADRVADDLDREYQRAIREVNALHAQPVRA